MRYEWRTVTRLCGSRRVRRWKWCLKNPRRVAAWRTFLRRRKRRLSGCNRSLRLRLSDRLLDLDRPVRVVANGKEWFSGQVTRRARVILTSLEERADPVSAASAWVEMK